MLRRLTLALTAALLFASPAVAGTMQDSFQEANSDYWKKKYESAKDGYNTLIERYKLRNAVVFYNLANSHFQLDELGLAILNYKRALVLEPEKELAHRVRDNLNKTTSMLMDRHARDIKGSITVLDESHGATYSLFHLLKTDQAALIFAAFWVLLLGSLLVRRLVEGDEAKRALKAVTVTLVVFTVLAATLFGGNLLTSESVVRAVVVSPNIQLRDGRQKDAPATDVPEGLEVQVLDDSDPTETRIRLSNGREGWIPASGVEII
jgi:hypothetical protein